MIPDTELQLSVVIKALETAIAPALDPANRLALEQCQLAIATLGFIRERLPLARRFVRRELQDNLALAESLRDQNPKELTLALDRGHSSLLDPELDTFELAAVNSDLLSAITTVVEAAPGDRDIALVVIAAMQDQAERARAWYLPAGFEPDPALIPAIETLLPDPR